MTKRSAAPKVARERPALKCSRGHLQVVGWTKGSSCFFCDQMAEAKRLDDLEIEAMANRTAPVPATLTMLVSDIGRRIVYTCDQRRRR